MERTSRAPPPKWVSRRYVLPALIGLSLVAVGIGIALMYRGHGSSATRPETASNRSPQSSSASSAPSSATSYASPPSTSQAPTVAASAPPAVAGAGRPASVQTSKPPVAADTKVVAAAHSGAPIAILHPLPKAAAEMEDNDNCPYPRTAMDQGITGTVFLLVYVTPDGAPTKTKIVNSSGSDVLDQAALSCVEQFGRFPAPADGSPGGYWGRIRFKWSFGI